MDSSGEKVCPICKGLGYIITERGAKKCRCVYTNFDIAKFLNIPTRFKDANILGLRKLLNIEIRRTLHTYLTKFREHLKDGIGLLLVGPPGVGKTYTAVAILKSIYKNYRVRGYFTDTKELAIKLRELFAGGEHLKYVELLSKIPVLVLDDLGNEPLTDWYKDILLGIINKRYNEKKVTIITTSYYPSYLLYNAQVNVNGFRIVDKEKKEEKENISKDFLLDKRYGSHLISRIGEMTLPVIFSGEDKRVKKVVY